MPPIIGAAIRLITSEPAPVPHRIGSRPAIITATVIAFGRTRRTAPWPDEIAANLDERIAEHARLDFAAYTSGALALR